MREWMRDGLIVAGRIAKVTTVQLLTTVAIVALLGVLWVYILYPVGVIIHEETSRGISDPSARIISAGLIWLVVAAPILFFARMHKGIYTEFRRNGFVVHEEFRAAATLSYPRSDLHNSEYDIWVHANTTDDMTPEQVNSFKSKHRDAWIAANVRSLEMFQIASHEAAHAVVSDALGHTVTSIQINSPKDHVGASVNTQSPVPKLPDVDVNWTSLIGTMAGQASDILNGDYHTGSVSDVSKAMSICAAIISTGQRPKGYHGSLTTEAMLAAARDEATRILADRSDAHDRLTKLLIEKGHVSYINGREVKKAIQEG